jgi:hypothetical protein
MYVTEWNFAGLPDNRQNMGSCDYGLNIQKTQAGRKYSQTQ